MSKFVISYQEVATNVVHKIYCYSHHSTMYILGVQSIPVPYDISVLVTIVVDAIEN